MEGFTVRLEPTVMEELRDESEARDVSVNTLANQIFADFTKWDRHASKSGWIPMQSFVLQDLLNYLDEKTISEIALRAAEKIGGDILIMGGNDNLNGFLSKVRMRARKSGFHIKEHKDKERLEIILHHNLGWKWSVFFKVYYQYMLQKFKQNAMLDFTENIIVMILPRSENP